MVPNFLGIGAQKAGTTWIYEILSLHFAIRFPAVKEVHFWDAHRDKGVDWWFEQFGQEDPQVRAGEITPAYALLPEEDIQELYRLCPHLRLFYVLRNPIERIWSAARMAVLRAEMAIEEASDQWFLDYFQASGPRRRGAYAETITRWRSVFPAEQLLIAFHDDLKTRPRRFLSDLCGHIGVDGGFYDPMADEVLERVVFEGPARRLSPGLWRFLLDQYSGPVDALSRLLDIDLSHWLAEPSS